MRTTLRTHFRAWFLLPLLVGLALFALRPSLYAGRDMIPESRRITWWDDAGVKGGIPAVPVAVSVTDFGAAGDGVTDDAAAFQAAIDSVSGQGAVAIPAGTYRIGSELEMTDGVVLRGAGPQSTHLEIDHSGVALNFEHYDRGTWVAATGSLTKGSTTIEVANSAEFVVGGYGELQQDNDPALMYTDPAWDTSWAAGAVGQLFQVVAIDGNILTIDPPLNIDYRSDLNPIVRDQGFLEYAGVENLHITRVSSNDAHLIYFKNAANVWVSNVHTQLAAKSHISTNTTYRITVVDSYIEDATNFGGGGHGYGVEFGFHTTAGRVENNVFRRLRHAMMVHVGANNNVFGYNYSTITQSEGTWLPPDISVHGHYAFANLFEGNIVEEVGVGDYWGPAGLANVYFRNRVETAEDFNIIDASHGQNVVGNELPVGNINIVDNATDLLIHGNREQGVLSWDSSIADQDLPASYYYDSKPAFYGGMAWPSLGSDIIDGTNPAKQRYLSGDIFGPTPTPGPTNTPGPSPTATPLSPTPTPLPTADPSAALKLQYRTSDTNPSDNGVRPHLRIVNNGTSAVSLTDLTMRYWFTAENSSGFNFFCDYAQVNCSNVSGSFGMRGDGERYLEVAFGSGAGSLAASSDTGPVQLRFAHTNWANQDETNDYSYDPTKSAFADWNRVTLYHNGSLVWGIEPGGVAPTSTPVATATSAEPTATHVSLTPTATTVLPTATVVPPTATPAVPTATPTVMPPTATATTVAPTATSTPAPPTATATAASPTATPTGTPATSSGCAVDYDIVNQWGNGFQANVTITNLGVSAVGGYTLSWDFANGEQVSSGWNASFSQTGTTASASNTASHWNGTIQPNGSVSFGFVGSHSGTFSTPTAFTLNGTLCQ